MFIRLLSLLCLTLVVACTDREGETDVVTPRLGDAGSTRGSGPPVGIDLANSDSDAAASRDTLGPSTPSCRECPEGSIVVEVADLGVSVGRCPTWALPTDEEMEASTVTGDEVAWLALSHSTGPLMDRGLYERIVRDWQTIRDELPELEPIQPSILVDRGLFFAYLTDDGMDRFLRGERTAFDCANQAFHATASRAPFSRNNAIDVNFEPVWRLDFVAQQYVELDEVDAVYLSASFGGAPVSVFDGLPLHDVCLTDVQEFAVDWLFVDNSMYVDRCPDWGFKWTVVRTANDDASVEYDVTTCSPDDLPPAVRDLTACFWWMRPGCGSGGNCDVEYPWPAAR